MLSLMLRIATDMIDSLKNMMGTLFLCVLFSALCTDVNGQETNYGEVSKRLLQHLKEGKNTNEEEAILRSATVEALEKELVTDAQKKAFWINIYNGYIQIILKKSPELYDNKTSFFNKDQVNIIGKTLSFADIEHGILRRSKVDYMLGYISNPFPPKYERRLRVKKLDPRIHFGLNCGAKDCPPVDIYDASTYEEQIETNTTSYLSSSTIYTDTYRKAKVTSLFSWFRGDFGGYKGIRRFLHRYTPLPKGAKIKKISFKSYDWTLHLDYFVE